MRKRASGERFGSIWWRWPAVLVATLLLTVTFVKAGVGEVLARRIAGTSAREAPASIGLAAPMARVQALARVAALEAGVPAAVLLATAYAERRLQLPRAPAAGAGWIQLLPWRPTRSAFSVAPVLGLSRDAIYAKPELGLRAAAQLIAHQGALHGAHLDDPLSWRDALAAWNGATFEESDSLYAEDIMDIVAHGLSVMNTDGSTVETRRSPDRPREAPAVSARPDDVVGDERVPFLRGSDAAGLPLAVEPRRVRYVVIHTMENTFATIVDFFRRPTTGVAAHYLVRARDGFALQMADERAVVFHDACFNEESIGIEHEGYLADGPLWFSDAMYRESARIVRGIALRHHIPLDREHVLGHSEAPDCSEHSDPGPHWDWKRYMQYLREDE